MLLYTRRVTTYEFMIGAQWCYWRFTHVRSARAAGCSSFRACSWLADGVQLSPQVAGIVQLVLADRPRGGLAGLARITCL